MYLMPKFVKAVWDIASQVRCLAVCISRCGRCHVPGNGLNREAARPKSSHRRLGRCAMARHTSQVARWKELSHLHLSLGALDSKILSACILSYDVENDYHI
ncbi:unnamed protein product [Durusdinium trenchii]|uniref:Uncharacterized protein n=1 Tax=Durusdinium trenchii TaxID=1381693 RepID=A0ABP0KL10_9DINO